MHNTTRNYLRNYLRKLETTANKIPWLCKIKHQWVRREKTEHAKSQGKSRYCKRCRQVQVYYNAWEIV